VIDRTGWQVWVEWVWRSMVGMLLGSLAALLWSLMFNYLFIALITTFPSQYNEFFEFIKIDIQTLNSFVFIASIGVSAFIASYGKARMELSALRKLTNSEWWDNRWANYSSLVHGIGAIINQFTGYYAEFNIITSGFIIYLLWGGLLLGYIQANILADRFERVYIWVIAVTLTAFSIPVAGSILASKFFNISDGDYLIIFFPLSFSILSMITGLAMVRLVKRPLQIEE